ncbi:MAG: nuclease [Ponticaulis sp.]|nr:nuclease [Ponticaulis sp.]
MIGFIAIAIAGLVIRSRWFKGWFGEFKVNSVIKRNLDKSDYRLLSDLTLPSRGGTTQIDHVVLSRFGVFVIETKNMLGLIFGTANQSKWTQVVFRRKSSFQNPIRQNFKHVRTVQELLGLKSHQIHSLVAFVGSATPKTLMPSDVVWGADSVAEAIGSKQIELIDPEVLDELETRLSEARLEPSIFTNRAHVKHVKTRAAERKKGLSSCPRCGSGLVKRTNEKSGERFWGCSKFPRCRGTRRATA